MTELIETVDSFLLSAPDAAKMLGVSRAHYLKLHCAGRVPMPVRLGRRVLWRRTELEEWVEAGCPPRERWDTLKGAQA